MMASKVWPVRPWSSIAAADLPTWRSTLAASSSWVVQFSASARSSSRAYGEGRPSMAALSRWVLMQPDYYRSSGKT
jgi:hypothetical protein